MADVDDSFWIEFVIEVLIAFVLQTFDHVNSIHLTFCSTYSVHVYAQEHTSMLICMRPGPKRSQATKDSHS